VRHRRGLERFNVAPEHLVALVFGVRVTSDRRTAFKQCDAAGGGAFTAQSMTVESDE
jgi:hypothetical protein